MGSGSHSTQSYKSVVQDLKASGQTFARSTTAAATGNYNNIADNLNPRKFKNGKRESCFKPGTDTLLSIFVALDATASMGDVPAAVRDGLPSLLDTLIQQNICAHPNIAFAVFDDEHAIRPDAAFQMSQYEIAPAELVTALNEAVFPGHGGGNQGEAYHLPIYAAAYHTRLESYELQQQKGVFVLVCDEQPYYHDGDFNVHGTSVSIAKEVFGDVIEKEVSMVESMTKLLETHHVLIIRPQHTQNGRTKSITKRWQDLLKAAGGNPEHVLEVEATNAIIATIALYIGQFIAAMDQADLVDVLRGNGADGIDAAARATSSIVAFAGAALAVGNTNTELVPSDMDGAPRAR